MGLWAWGAISHWYPQHSHRPSRRLRAGSILAVQASSMAERSGAQRRNGENWRFATALLILFPDGVRSPPPVASRSCCGARATTFSEFAALTGYVQHRVFDSIASHLLADSRGTSLMTQWLLRRCLVSKHTQNPGEDPDEVRCECQLPLRQAIRSDATLGFLGLAGQAAGVRRQSMQQRQTEARLRNEMGEQVPVSRAIWVRHGVSAC